MASKGGPECQLFGLEVPLFHQSTINEAGEKAKKVSPWEASVWARRSTESSCSQALGQNASQHYLTSVQVGESVLREERGQVLESSTMGSESSEPMCSLRPFHQSCQAVGRGVGTEREEVSTAGP